MDAIINRIQNFEDLDDPLPLLEVRLTLRELDEVEVKELFAVVLEMTDNFDFSCMEMDVEEEDKKTNDEYWNFNETRFLGEPELSILEPRDEDEDYPTKEN